MSRTLDELGHIITVDRNTDEMRSVHTAYQLLKRGFDFHEWVEKPVTEAEAKLAELLKAEAEKSEKKPAKPKFDKAKYEEWAKADSRYVELVERIKTSPKDTETMAKLQKEAHELAKALEKEFRESLKAA